MYQVPLAGDTYMEDNKKVYLKLKEYLVETEGWAWIKTFDRSQDGQAAYQSWTDHYNGAGELDKHTQHAKAKLDSLYFKNERAFPFEQFSGKIKQCITMINKDPDQVMFQGISMQNIASNLLTHGIKSQLTPAS